MICIRNAESGAQNLQELHTPLLNQRDCHTSGKRVFLDGYVAS